MLFSWKAQGLWHRLCAIGAVTFNVPFRRREINLLPWTEDADETSEHNHGFGKKHSHPHPQHQRQHQEQQHIASSQLSQPPAYLNSLKRKSTLSVTININININISNSILMRSPIWGDSMDAARIGHLNTKNSKHQKSLQSAPSGCVLRHLFD